jgi:septal ring factor EnvC (AmiA/AmiB activator)
MAFFKHESTDHLAPAPDPAAHGGHSFTAAAPAAPAGAAKPRYGIADAIALMHSLPPDLQTTDVIVQIIKRTLESANIDVAAIIVDATQKADALEKRIMTLQEEIAKHEHEIQTRAAEISRLQTDNSETRRVKEKLLLGEKP